MSLSADSLPKLRTSDGAGRNVGPVGALETSPRELCRSQPVAIVYKGGGSAGECGQLQHQKSSRLGI